MKDLFSADAARVKQPYELEVTYAGATNTVTLRRGCSYLVGRGADCDIYVPDGAISRVHARVSVSDGEVTIEDLGSQNGTFVGGARVATGEVVALAVGEPVVLGVTTLTLQEPRPLASNTMAPPPTTPCAAAVQDATRAPLVVDPAMRRIYATLDVVGPSPLSVLIIGETGVGKQLVGEQAHCRSARARMPFLQLNCAAFPESLLEAELFGYEMAAFTGATRAKEGLFESADGGSIFLDEIGELPLAVQAKLLTTLESGQVLRLGSTRPRRVDVRFLSATNRDLKRAVAAKAFRSDLYFRLNGITIHVPALRERTADIAPLAAYFAERIALSVGARPPRLTPAAIGHLEGHAWPGNVRELKNVIERAVVLCRGGELGPEHIVLDDSVAPDTEPTFDDVEPSTIALDGARPRRLAPLKLGGDAVEERERVLAALTQCAGNQSQAARMLGISRHTLIDRITEYGIPRPRKRPG